VILTLLTALSIASSPAIDVPFLPQTEALCGGASVAMVLRYWGETRADVRQFTPLVERRTGRVSGIANDALVDAVRARGWRTESAGGSIAGLAARISAHQPVIVLLADGLNRYHYVVVVGVPENSPRGEILVHDPSWGPSRTIDVPSFTRRWAASGQWSLVILPGETRAVGDTRTPALVGTRNDEARRLPPGSCDVMVAKAVAETQSRGLDHADEILGPLRAQCPLSAAPARELAGVRFAQGRWPEADALAREAIERQQDDEFAHLVLGASRFMQDDQIGALRAWNEIGQPRLDRVNVEGLRRSRYQTVTDSLGLAPPALLTADEFLRARHRLDELPIRSSARMALKPEDDGFASVDVVIAEQPGRPRGFAEWVGAAVRTGVDREIGVTQPGFTGQGELWSASWRWWNNRPRVAVGFAAPRVGGLPGVWRVEGSWEIETYGAGGARLARESRAHGGLSVSDWLTGSVRYSLGAGVDAWDTGVGAASAGASLEKRWLDDRVALAGSATTWVPISARTTMPATIPPAAPSGGAPWAGFRAVSARASVQSTRSAHVWRYQAAAGAEQVSDAAPLTLWAGAGEGVARAPLLRAHPLLDNGIVDTSAASVFGRSVQYGTVELQRWFDRPAIVRIGLAGFADLARATRTAIPGQSVGQTDLGAGVRVRLPGAEHVLRIDLARGLRDGANALTIGWSY
jgi:hypothetical protein